MSKEKDLGFDAQTVEAAAQAISQATAFLFTAGAGMGVDSGLPDFRGNEGFWKAYPALHGYAFEDMANPEWFVKDPNRAWGFYGHRLNLYRKTIPHHGFSILKEWAKDRPYFVFTSNVDGQFQKAGFSEERIYECHGSIHWLQHLSAQKGSEIWSAKDTEVHIDETQIRAEGILPNKDGELVRPNILMFGDWHWNEDRSAAQLKNLELWLEKTDLSRLVVIEAGAGTAIPSVRRFSSRMAKENGILIRINPRESMGGDIQFACGALCALEAIKGVL